MEKQDLASIRAYYKGFRLIAVVVAMTLTLFLTSMDTSIVATILTPIIENFKNYSEVTAWIIPAYTISTACCCLIAARIASVINIKYGICLGILIFEIGSILTAASKNLNMLFVGRCLSGIGAAFINNLVYLIVIEIVEEEKLSTFLIILSMAFNMGTILGPIIGSAFIERFTNNGWRYCFWINLPIGFSGMIVLLLSYNHDSDNYWVAITKFPKATKFFLHKCKSFSNWKKFFVSIFFDYDIVEFCACAIGFVLLFLGLTDGSDEIYKWNNYRVIILLVIGSLTIIFAFLWDTIFYQKICYANKKTPKPLIDPLCYQSIGLLGTNICVFCSSCSFIMVLIYLIQFYQIVLVQSTLVKIVPLFVSSSLTVIVCGRFIRRTGMVKWVIINGAILGCIGAGILQLLDFDMTTGKVIGYTILVGIGFGAQIQSTMIAVQLYLTNKDNLGTEEEKIKAELQRIDVNSFYTFMKQLGMATGPIIGNTIFSVLLPKKVHKNKELSGLHHMNVNQLVVYRLTEDFENLEDELGKIMQSCVKSVMWAAFALFAINLIASLFLSGKKVPHKGYKKEPVVSIDESDSDDTK
ncbi:hypothetical protein QEN19_000767 [Hanseniaspora menglaensis]